MNILLATPCLTGITHTYANSLVQTVQGFELHKIPFNTLFLANESCIMRARNDIAHYAMTSPEKYTHLLMVDSDMGWEWDTFVHLANAKRRIISAVCVKKTYPIEEVVHHLDGEVIEPSGVIKVRHSPVAFMLLDLSVIRDHAKVIDDYSCVSAITGKRAIIKNLFATGPDENGNFQSEDFAFTSLMRKCGESIYLHTRAKTTHTGLHTFRPGAKCD